MPFNGSGVFSVINTFVSGTTILSSAVNANYSDIATGLSTCILKDGTQAITATIPFSLASTVAVPVQVVSTNADANVGPIVEIYRNSGSPVDADVGGAIYWYGKDSGGTKTLFASVTAVFDDITDTTEDGSLLLGTVVAGSAATRMAVGAGVYHPSATGGDKGANTLNFGTLYLNGTALGTAATGTLGTSGATVPLLNGTNTWAGGNTFDFISISGDSTTHSYLFGILATDKVTGTWTSTFYFSGDAAIVGSISHVKPFGVGGSTAYNTSSDGRLKPEKDRRPIIDSGDIIDRLNPIYFKWGGVGDEDFGFVAQEVYEIAPGAVTKGSDEPLRPGTMTEDGKIIPGPMPWQMERGRLEPFVVAELKALRKRVAELEVTLATRR